MFRFLRTIFRHYNADLQHVRVNVDVLKLLKSVVLEDSMYTKINMSRHKGMDCIKNCNCI